MFYLYKIALELFLGGQIHVFFISDFDVCFYFQFRSGSLLDVAVLFLYFFFKLEVFFWRSDPGFFFIKKSAVDQGKYVGSKNGQDFFD